MSEIRKEKEAVVEEIKTKIQAAKSVVLVDYKGLTVAQDTELRCNFRKAGVEYKVYKNRLAKIAFNELGFNQFDEALEGPTAIAFSMNDSVSAAKISAEANKKYNKLQTKCGLVDGEFNDADALKIIASLPSREVLIAKMLGSMLAPVSKLAYVLNAIAEKQEAQA
ncbi:MAG: 50S ribosomal protein L10 [Eubacteriales bacterium]|nr:50S ribosomal protein L10 [Christensenellaceae bacterium]MDD7246175.1 50S ribosomal protein L10 [Christensenellaceae bacterium]MDY2751832.1 50S ribosomal protein L10 [Eubacteriales bacterium]MDY4708969.1 50S ribosomal protein L10 [Eubacteriales bacterium]MDY6078355.1 50S ribosomal protein L10 [Eubacteriales bacterium]